MPCNLSLPNAAQIRLIIDWQRIQTAIRLIMDEVSPLTEYHEIGDAALTMMRELGFESYIRDYPADEYHGDHAQCPSRSVGALIAAGDKIRAAIESVLDDSNPQRLTYLGSRLTSRIYWETCQQYPVSGNTDSNEMIVNRLYDDGDPSGGPPSFWSNRAFWREAFQVLGS